MLKAVDYQIFHVPHDRMSVFLISSFKIQELSQKRQLISNSTSEAESQTQQTEELLELRLPLELAFTALVCFLM